jgi:hypothetical protein
MHLLDEGGTMKTLCKIRPKEYEAMMPQIKSIVSAPKYLCKKCLRVASEKGALCKAIKL